MPIAAGVLRADDLAVFIEYVGEHENFIVPAQARFLAHVRFKHAKAAGEGDLLFRRELLLAKHRHFVVKESIAHGLECCVIERARKIDAGNFSAQVFAKAGDGNHG